MSTSNIPKRVGDRREVSHEAVITERRPAVSEKTAARQDNDAPRLHKNQQDARRSMFHEAREHVALMPASSAVNSIRALPIALQELYILAEMDGMKRPQVLMYFPKPGQTGYQRYGEFMRTQPAAVTA